MRHVTSPVAVVLSLVLLVAVAPVRADEAPVARQYMTWLNTTLGRIQNDLPQYTRAAELAVGPFIEGKDVGVRGGARLASELGGRAGGFMAMRGQPGRPGDVILYAFGVTTSKDPDPAALLDAELTDAADLRTQGSVVIGLASYAQLREHGQLTRALQATDILLDNHAPAGDGLFRTTDGRAVIPTFVTADAAAAWVFACELFAACTRQGKTPTMYQSVAVPGGRMRNAKYQGNRFHGEAGPSVAPIAAGVLGKAYLTELRAVLRDVGTASWTALARAGHLAARAYMDGGTLFVRAGGHYPAHHHGGRLPTDPGLFLPLDHDGSNPRLPRPGRNDFVLAVGYCFPPEDNWWGDPRVLREAGRGTAWAIAGYLTKPIHLREQEFLVDQQWAEGDALVKVPGYDVRIAPPSAVTAEAILWAITAQTAADVNLLDRDSIANKPNARR